MAELRRGDIRNFTFKAPDKRRPVLILTRDGIIDSLNSIVVASLTTTIRDIETEVLLLPLDGVERDCVVNLDNINSVDKSKIGSLIARLSREKMLEVDRAIVFALGMSI
ncbi:MAG: type II toxin-antitoxin system PemK/MazF family toxin [Candidatus Obscuribacterales bacterium]|nr:type II toxin-antitoxin system PemK/MazF family toxin [Candidatus Obscuribacterales bacterium]